jgi:hypothetical protein
MRLSFRRKPGLSSRRFRRKVYEPRGDQPVRRILLNRTRYHLYYRPDDTDRKILIDAIWYAGRGQAPPLGG